MGGIDFFQVEEGMDPKGHNITPALVDHLINLILKKTPISKVAYVSFHNSSTIKKYLFQIRNFLVCEIFSLRALEFNLKRL